MGSIDISKTKYVSAEEICERVSVGRSTFDRWRKQSPISPGGFQGAVLGNLRTAADIENEGMGLTPFPEPTLHVGGQPRWDVEVVNAWLNENQHKQNRRGRSAF